MKIFQSCFENKIYDYLESNPSIQNVCILMNHGLGDIINFIPIFDKLKSIFKNCSFKLGSLPEKGYKCLHEDAIFMVPPYGKYSETFDVIFNISYLEPPRDEHNGFFINSLDKAIDNELIKKLSKVELCNYLEVGIPDFKWNYYKININCNPIKRIGVHFFGYAWTKDKNVDIDTSYKIWNEIIKSGYDPYEIQMIPPNKVGIIEHPEFLNRGNSLRYNFPNLKLMMQEVSKCNYFFGVDSGPLYLAISILGPNSCIGLQKNREISKIFPRPSINLVDVKNYNDDSIKFLLTKEEDDVSFD